jgi:dipeptidyl aminopeptidase/acylaminoacyl peptidase
METRIRERLHDLATEAPSGIGVPPPVLRRARLRVGLTVATSAVVLVAVAVGAVAGARLFQRMETRPAAQPGATAFDRVRGWIVHGGGHLVAVDPANPSDRLRLTAVPEVIESPLDWSSDGTRLLFIRRPASNPDPSGGDLFVLNADGTEARLTTGGGVVGGSFSPSATQAAFARVTGREEGQDLDSVFVVPTAGGIPREIETGGEWPVHSYPAWAPEGDRIFYFGEFVDSGDDHPGLAVANADGTGDAVAVGGLLPDVVERGTAGLTWSPDGTRLVFAGTSGAGHSAIYVVRANGTGLSELIGGQRAAYAWPAWSPDGSRIAFVAEERLFSMSADGTDVRELGNVPSEGGGIAWHPLG